MHHLCERLETLFERQDALLKAMRRHTEYLMNEGMDEQELIELNEEITVMIEGKYT